MFAPHLKQNFFKMKAKWSGIGTVDGRGKLNGSVASKNKSGAIWRVKVTPLNPRTPAQVSVRAIFGGLSTAWKTLTQAQRDAWNALANNVTYTDIFGDARKINGNSFYVKLNANLSAAGQSTISNAPVYEPPTYEIGLDVNASVSSVVLISMLPEVPAGTTAIVQATPCVSAGKLNISNRYRQITTIDSGGVLNSADVYSQYRDTFGSPIVDQRLGVRVWLVDNTTGAASLKNDASVIVS